MTTQVTKTRSIIVKSVAAAVLLAACTTTTFAGNNEYFSHENTKNIKTQQVRLLSSLNTAITLSTGVENVPAHLNFAAEHGSQIKAQGRNAANALQADVAVNTEALFSELTASLDFTVEANTNEVFAENGDNYETILPSIASIGEEYEVKMRRAIQIAALETLDYALSVSFNNTSAYLE